ncbi:hypothetical protein [Lactobacillus sp. Sy-1]|uniref:hypothetical protein n=1 Tax=Lactobacillus sp. Sy-1 TaxID=2109645 RepID=UPI001C5ABC64|nr:hypothetical protein [Lactobacillus sp. Sy-1]MBW1606173.1 hypothetical protein [Lactobacillus sp. Sy-1]
MIEFSIAEAHVLSAACRAFKSTMATDNQRGRSELEQLSTRLLQTGRLNSFGTDFTLLKLALKNYRKTVQSPADLTIIDNLIVRFKDRC